jgi:hypothetical protein
MSRRNSIFACFFAVAASLWGIGYWQSLAGPAKTARASQKPALFLRTALLTLHPRSDGSSRAGSARKLQRGDRVQLTIHPEQAGYLMVGTLSAGQLTVLYPQPEQSGQVRGGWAYALPDPSRFYVYDGTPMQIVTVFRGKALPRSVAERRAILRHALRLGSSRSEVHGSIPLATPDQQRISTPVTRYRGQRQVTAVLALSTAPPMVR